MEERQVTKRSYAHIYTHNCCNIRHYLSKHVTDRSSILLLKWSNYDQISTKSLNASSLRRVVRTWKIVSVLAEMQCIAELQIVLYNHAPRCEQFYATSEIVRGRARTRYSFPSDYRSSSGITRVAVRVLNAMLRSVNSSRIE